MCATQAQNIVSSDFSPTFQLAPLSGEGGKHRGLFPRMRRYQIESRAYQPPREACGPDNRESRGGARRSPPRPERAPKKERRSRRLRTFASSVTSGIGTKNDAASRSIVIIFNCSSAILLHPTSDKTFTCNLRKKCALYYIFVRNNIFLI